ncbi:MAG: hypothetical protein H7A43_07190 [Verrucomicrobia bacterium]|nr:hypothetical protein [Verrucomicrobiota bacterium]
MNASSTYWRSGAALLVIGALIPVVHTGGTWLHGPRLLSALAVAGIATLAGAWRSPHNPDGSAVPDTTRAAGLLTLGLLIAVSSSWVQFQWFFFPDWREHQDFVWPSIHLVFLLNLLLAGWILTRRPSGWRTALGLMLVLPLLAGILAVWQVTGGAAIYKDDHPSFMYRLWLFRETFPRMVNYVPQWNAGTVDATPILTGAWIPGLVGFPLWLVADPHVYYTAGFIWMFMLLVPLLAGLSTRMLGGSLLASLAAAVLALLPTRYYSLWVLHFGTLGGNFAMALVMPVAGLLFVLLWNKRAPLGAAIALALVIIVMNLWPLSPFMAFPFVLAIAWNLRRLTGRSSLLIGGAAAVAGVILYPYLNTLLNQAGIDAGALMRQGRPPFSAIIIQGATLFRDQIRMANPLLVFLGLAAPLLVLKGSQRRWLAPITLGFILLSGWSDVLFPNRQLHRMSIALFFMTIPATALTLDVLLETTGWRRSWLAALVAALVAASGWNARLIYQGRGVETYGIFTPGLHTLAERVAQETPPEGRVILAGAVGEDYEDGHMGYLPILFHRELLGNAYRHDQDMNPWAGTPPAHPPGTPAEFKTWVDTFAGHLIITIEDEWRNYLRAQPESYEERGQVTTTHQTYTLFRVRHPAPLFAAGEGRVEAHPNHLIVNLNDPEVPAILRYRWTDGLTVSPPAELYPAPVNQELSLIGIRPGGETHLVIRYSSP